jgi:hypothetical protein
MWKLGRDLTSGRWSAGWMMYGWLTQRCTTGGKGEETHSRTDRSQRRTTTWHRNCLSADQANATAIYSVTYKRSMTPSLTAATGSLTSAQTAAATADATITPATSPSSRAAKRTRKKSSRRSSGVPVADTSGFDHGTRCSSPRPRSQTEQTAAPARPPERLAKLVYQGSQPCSGGQSGDPEHDGRFDCLAHDPRSLGAEQLPCPDRIS